MSGRLKPTEMDPVLIQIPQGRREERGGGLKTSLATSSVLQDTFFFFFLLLVACILLIDIEEGPSGVNLLDFVGARATELKSMVTALNNKGGGKRVFQTLPRHMRRRAMSHNPKRLPRHLRELAAREVATSSAQEGV